jgi:hypothetical protein
MKRRRGNSETRSWTWTADFIGQSRLRQNPNKCIERLRAGWCDVPPDVDPIGAARGGPTVYEAHRGPHLAIRVGSGINSVG